jgi:cyclopropane fatty-acyl-phospholipid synthase-like methyltransferase
VKRLTANHRHFYDRIVLPWLPLDRSCAIAELACGHGSFLVWLSQLGFDQIVGVDSSHEQAEIAIQTGATIEIADAIQWISQHPSSSLDIIVAIDFAEHISKDDFMELLSQSIRVLKNKGRLILRLPNGESPFVGSNLFNDITHLWTYTPNCLDTLAKMHGYQFSMFHDESTVSIRDHRWIKVPISRIACTILTLLVFCAAKVKIRMWSPNLWACLVKS